MFVGLIERLQNDNFDRPGDVDVNIISNKQSWKWTVKGYVDINIISPCHHSKWTKVVFLKPWQLAADTTYNY
jgi:hypothetical protein